MWPCMAVTRVPWVHMLTWGRVWAKPRNPAPTKLITAQPSVHIKAMRLGLLRPPRRAMARAYMAMPRNARGSRAENTPPTISQ